jgi:hypothetical protein
LKEAEGEKFLGVLKELLKLEGQLSKPGEVICARSLP